MLIRGITFLLCVCVAGIACAQQPPSAQDAMRAFSYVRARVESALDGDTDTPMPDIAATGVNIVVRHEQHIVARGTSWSLGSPLMKACDQLVQELVRHFPDAHDPLARSAAREPLKQVIISLELAGETIPLDIESFRDANQRSVMGLDGVVLRWKGELSGCFPSDMLRASDAPGGAIMSLVSAASGDPTLPVPGAKGHDAGDIAREKGATYARFRVIHLAQTVPGGPPLIMYRGGTLVPSSWVSRESLAECARRIAGHIASRSTVREARPAMWRSIHALRATRGEELAGPFESALAAIALCRHATIEPQDRNVPIHAHVSLAHELIIDWLAVEKIAQEPSTDATTSAAMLLACAEAFRVVGTPAGDWWPGSRDALSARVLACLDDQGAWQENVPLERRGMIVRAIAELASNPLLGHMDARLAERARAAIASVYRETKPGFLATHMPWLYDAQLALDGPQGELPQSGALREMRKLLWERQIRQEQLIGLPPANDPGQDMVGGIDLTQDASIDADWRTARLFPALARMANDARLTDDGERIRELSRILAGARFIRQLCTDESAASFSSDPGFVQWGVRSAPWDARMPLEASAMGLISLTETIRAVDAIAREAALPPPAPQPVRQP